ncbi:hypothetical protein DBV15_07878 [Temnothorax longispinosus]|uniref:Uncharacterized protein n=1 Tax=Temnothorax longispinosus TaxID=300112 RepID=A0A4S2JC04_9HYME|nr:hypothetical protein DBV15_07878 [Temnothorax longispinosus]
MENERRQQGRQLRTLRYWARTFFLSSPFSRTFFANLREARAVSLDSSFPTGVLPVEDFEDNLAPTIVKRFPSRTKVQAFTAEKTLSTVTPAVSYRLFLPYAKRDFIEHDTIRNRNIASRLKDERDEHSQAHNSPVMMRLSLYGAH